MDNVYQPSVVEAQAQDYWSRKKCFKAAEDLSREKFYCLSMFPYPSGSLHMGHVRNYTLGDVIARYQRMLGKNVLQPIGWDAFGLPAENAAIKHHVPPAEWTRQNIDNMRAQFKRLGNAYDWRREIATCDPDYYRWEQWLFIKLFQKGLAYKKNAVVNWDPVDQTVLANEQVVDGKGWRSGAPVERREISQWFLKITDYADELLAELDNLTGWPEQVITQQKHWIGRSQGLEISFAVAEQQSKLYVFTTRPDTLMGVTYLGLAPTHPLAVAAAKTNPRLTAFIEQCRHTKVAEAEIATQEKLGIDTGLKAIHPITGELIPIWVANFVLLEYGTGAIMAVPAHDQRDWEFAEKYQLTKKIVLSHAGQLADISQRADTQLGEMINSGEFDGTSSADALGRLADALAADGKAKLKINYRLRDWGVSRQRYWGTPIPIINCPSCGTVPVPEEDLPVTLPENLMPTGHSSPLTTATEFLAVHCPKCDEPAQRETDTFDTFVESSWYYARFASHNQDKAMLDDRAKYWSPVDQYIGGIEHAVMHLLYARFMHKVLRDEGLLNSSEPFLNLLTQGMVLKDGAKMSKSKGNTVDPNDLIDQYGADTIRLFITFAAPPEQSLEWSDAGVEGAHRFLKRLWAFAQEHHALFVQLNDGAEKLGLIDEAWEASASDALKAARHAVHQLLTQADYDYQRQQFNTVVSAGMKLLNILTDLPNIATDKPTQYFAHEGLSITLRLLAPITPHICHVLWQQLAFPSVLIDSTWPRATKSAMKLEKIEFVVQVNGKLRGHVTIDADAEETAIVHAALSDPQVAKFIQDQPVKKSIVLRGRKLINLVV